MEIKSLENTPLSQIITCLLDAFSDYFVKMPDDLLYWENRFAGARVRYDLSFGAFDNKKLAGFIVNGIDFDNDQLTAFNTGTGVVEAYRGQGIVDKIYAKAIPKLKSEGVSRCALEVIQANARAIRVYERIGFTINKKYLCFKGEIKPQAEVPEIQKIEKEAYFKQENPFEKFYSWDNGEAAVRVAPEGVYHFYKVFHNGEQLGFFVVNPNNGYLPQFELSVAPVAENWNLLFAGIRQVVANIRVNNIDARRTEIIAGLRANGIENPIDQFEMEMSI